MSILMGNGSAHSPLLLIGSVVALSALLSTLGSAGALSQWKENAESSRWKQNTESAQARLKPGWVVGTITDAHGQAIKGAQFEVTVSGVTLRGGERVNFELDVDENGRFEQELPDGLYAISANVIKEFEGSTFRTPLHPADNKNEHARLASKTGIVKDFIWKLMGLHPGGNPKDYLS